jgi:hypothetical protein
MPLDHISGNIPLLAVYGSLGNPQQGSGSLDAVADTD